MKYVLFDDRILIVVRHITKMEIIDDTTIELRLVTHTQRLHLLNKEMTQKIFNDILIKIQNEEDYGKQETKTSI
jgi:hypothetical protein